MGKERRLSSDDRRRAIVDAVKTVFSEKGFDGTTTRDLAEAAGVSEALLYKHFPSKESLFEVMRDDCINGPMLAEFQRILELPSSTSTLILMVHFLANKLVSAQGQVANRVTNTLIIRSLLDDGKFACVMHQHFKKLWIPKFLACVKAAKAAGEWAEGGVGAESGAWFTHNLFAMIMLQRHPSPPAVDYKLTLDELTAQSVRFCLRGTGLTEDAIKRHYNPKALALLAK